MKKNILIGIFVVVILPLLVFLGLQARKIVGQVPVQQGASSTAISTVDTNSGAKASTMIADPANPDVITYTSYALGVQFSYLKNGGRGSGVVTPQESGNKILLAYIEDGKPDADTFNYVQVFQKLPNESIDHALRRLVSQEFTNSNCVVLSGSESNQYFIWDKREPVAQRGSDNTNFISSNGTSANNTCGYDMPLDFSIDPNFPEKIYYISHDTQVASYWADSAHSMMWYQTLRLLH